MANNKGRDGNTKLDSKEYITQTPLNFQMAFCVR